ncbi:MAG: TraR/DksA family transcriptional regulator [Gammaproteobacteria bacterium]|nr:TraR/DksA family transcriptional regulator [Gammaproteobacteria bacterium]
MGQQTPPSVGHDADSTEPDMVSLTEQDARRFQRLLAKRREELRWLIHDALIESKHTDYIELAGAVHDSGEAALERIKHGSFGKCSDCGNAIDRERLAAYPTAKRCIACQTKRETDRRGRRDATPSL